MCCIVHHPRMCAIKEIVTVTIIVCQQLKHENGQPGEEATGVLRNKIVGILCNSKTPKSNINKAKRQALKSPWDNKDITILLAHKGKVVVVMDREDYQSQCEKPLADKDTYKKIETKKPSPSYSEVEFKESSGPSRRQGIYTLTYITKYTPPQIPHLMSMLHSRYTKPH